MTNNIIPAFSDFSLDSSEKQIIAVVEKCPNYIFHLMAIAKVGFDGEYANTYKDSVLPEDIACIKEHKNLLSFGPGSGGELVQVMIFFPSYINLKSADAFKEYFSLLDMGFQTSNFQPFFEKYTSYKERLDIWTWNPMFNEEYLKSIIKYRKIITDLGKIYLRNYATYEEKVGDKEKTKLDKVALKINNYFKDKDLISKWEILTGKKFKFNNYYIVLCSAAKNGPDANSLGYDRNVFYHDKLFDHMTQSISHEVGTHILVDEFKEIISMNKFDLNVLYWAYENLAKFYNTIILKNKNLKYDMPHDKEYLKIYNELYNKNRDITPKDILVKGIESFQKSESKPK